MKKLKWKLLHWLFRYHNVLADMHIKMAQLHVYEETLINKRMEELAKKMGLY